ncbi:MAG: Fur family transcriptional regulator [Endozoicomonas sp.]
MTTLNINHDHHDHNQCISDALENARKVCTAKGSRLTAIRERVLELVWQSHRPIGAYEIMANLKQGDSKPAQPPTVYRALGFLVDHGLVHKLSSSNTYIGCHIPDKVHYSCFLICSCCQTTIELDIPYIKQELTVCAEQCQFSINYSNIELSGLCSKCRDN